MQTGPRWFLPVAITALLWNLLGCFAFLSDAMLTPEAIAKLTAAEQAMRAARPAWSIAATAAAVGLGAAGCVGLIMRRCWAVPVLIVSLAGVVLQDVWLFGLSGAAAHASPVAFVLQGLVLLIAAALVMLGRRGTAQGWIT